MKFAKRGNSFTGPTQFNKQMSFQIDKPFLYIYKTEGSAFKTNYMLCIIVYV